MGTPWLALRLRGRPRPRGPSGNRSSGFGAGAPTLPPRRRREKDRLQRETGDGSRLRGAPAPVRAGASCGRALSPVGTTLGGFAGSGAGAGLAGSVRSGIRSFEASPTSIMAEKPTMPWICSGLPHGRRPDHPQRMIRRRLGIDAGQQAPAPAIRSAHPVSTDIVSILNQAGAAEARDFSPACQGGQPVRPRKSQRRAA